MIGFQILVQLASLFLLISELSLLKDLRVCYCYYSFWSGSIYLFAHKNFMLGRNTFSNFVGVIHYWQIPSTFAYEGLLLSHILTNLAEHYFWLAVLS